MERFHSFYSSKQESIAGGTVKYLDYNGNVVICTEVKKDDGNKKYSNFNDAVYKGIVTKFYGPGPVYNKNTFNVNFTSISVGNSHYKSPIVYHTNSNKIKIKCKNVIIKKKKIIPQIIMSFAQMILN